MKPFNYILKLIIWSFTVSIAIRIIYGMYFAYTVPAFISAVILGITGALLLSPPSASGYCVISIFHIVLVSSLSCLYDYSGFLKSLSHDSAMYLLESAGKSQTIVSVFWPILFVTPVYFLCYVIFSGIVTSYRRRRYLRNTEEDVDSDSDNPEIVHLHK